MTYLYHLRTITILIIVAVIIGRCSGEFAMAKEDIPKSFGGSSTMVEQKLKSHGYVFVISYRYNDNSFITEIWTDGKHMYMISRQWNTMMTMRNHPVSRVNAGLNKAP
tara:strand:- start:1885 stop:2208 length:324 start_codon:yes stop_codon:yes gene_type:complete